MSDPDSRARNLLELLGIHFEDTDGLELMIHPLCADCAERPCFKTGKCPFVFSESQIEVDLAEHI